MGFYTVIDGIKANIFGLSFGDVYFEKLDDDTVALKKANGDLIKFRVVGVPDSGQNLDDTANWGDVQSYFAPISVGFDGASAPSPGANTGKFLICHTAGGGYSVGDIVYDDGSSLLSVVNNEFIATLVQIAGDLDLPAYGIYHNDGGAFSSATGGSGSPIIIEYDYEDTTELVSAMQAPDGSIVTRQINVITTAFTDNSATVEVVTKGSSPVTLFGTDDSRPKRIDQYEKPEIVRLGANEGGNIGLTVVPGTSTAGAGYYLVWFDSPNT